jgi:hypothetical protein
VVKFTYNDNDSRIIAILCRMVMILIRVEQVGDDDSGHDCDNYGAGQTWLQFLWLMLLSCAKRAVKLYHDNDDYKLHYGDDCNETLT